MILILHMLLLKMNEASVITDSIPAPEPGVRTRRMTPELKAMAVGQSALVDEATARCIRAHGYYAGWVVVVRKEGDKIRVWRTA